MTARKCPMILQYYLLYLPLFQSHHYQKAYAHCFQILLQGCRKEQKPLSVTRGTSVVIKATIMQMNKGMYTSRINKTNNRRIRTRIYHTYLSTAAD